MPKLANKKTSSCKLLEYNNNYIYQFFTQNNQVIRSTNVKFFEQIPFKYIYLNYFYILQLKPLRANNILKLLKIVLKNK